LRTAPVGNNEVKVNPLIQNLRSAPVGKLTVVGEFVDLIDAVIRVDLVLIFDGWIPNQTDLVLVVDEHSKLFQVVWKHRVCRELFREAAEHVGGFLVDGGSVRSGMIREYEWPCMSLIEEK
jgi:hypothetical protein